MQRFSPLLLIYILSFTLSHGIPGIIPLLPTFQREFQLNAIEVNTCLAYFSYTALFATPFAGFFYSKLPKRIFITLVNILYFSGQIGVCTSTDYSIMLCFRVMQGIGSAGLSILMTILPSEYYQNMERVKVVGKSHAIMALGLFFNPLISGFLALYSWRFSIIALAMPTVITLCVLSVTNLSEKYVIKPSSFSFTQVREVFKSPYIPNLFFALFILGGTDLSMPSLFSLFSAETYGYTSSTIGIIYAFGNIGMFCGASYLLARLLPEKNFPYILLGIFFIVGLLLINFTTISMPMYFLGFFLYYSLSGIVQPFLNYSISNAVPLPILTIGITASMTCFRAGQGVITTAYAFLKDTYNYETAFMSIACSYLFVLFIIMPVLKKQGKL